MHEFCQPLCAKKNTAYIPASKARLYVAFYVIELQNKVPTEQRKANRNASTFNDHVIPCKIIDYGKETFCGYFC